MGEAWTRGQALAFVARWHFLGRPKREPPRWLTFDRIEITIGSRVFTEAAIGIDISPRAARRRLARRTA